MYKGFSFIVCLTIVTLILIATFQLHTAAAHCGSSPSNSVDILVMLAVFSNLIFTLLRFATTDQSFL